MRRKKTKELVAARTGAIEAMEGYRNATIAFMDDVYGQYKEMLRTGVCPSCEAISTFEEVDEKHPDHALHEAAVGREADAYVEWVSKHAEDCRFLKYYFALPNWAAQFHIAIAMKEYVIPKSDGSSWMDFVPVRIPAPGDPPVPE